MVEGSFCREKVGDRFEEVWKSKGVGVSECWFWVFMKVLSVLELVLVHKSGSC